MLHFFQAMVLSGLFVGTIYGIILAAHYKMVLNDNVSTTILTIGSIIFGIGFFYMLIIVIKYTVGG